MKKIICIVIFAVIIISGLTFAFADDSEEDFSSSSVSSAYTEDEQSFINLADSDNDRDLRTLSVEVVRAASSTYTLDDIYNLLLSVYTTYTGRASWAVFDQSVYNLIVNNFSHYDSVSGNTYDTGSMLWIIRNCLLSLSDSLVPATQSSSIYSLINNINETLSLALVDANNTPYLVNIYNKLVDINSGFIDYTSALFYNSVGVAEYASRINSAIVSSYNGLHTQLSKLDTTNDKLTTINTSLQTKLTALNTHAQTIESKIDSQTNTISNDLSLTGAIASSVTSLQSDINNISWTNFFYSDNGNLYSITSDSLSLIDTPLYLFTNSNYYFKFKFSSSTENRYIYRFTLPLFPNYRQYSDNYNIEFFNYGSDAFLPIKTDYVYSYFTYNRGLEIILYNAYFDYSNVYIKVTPKDNNSSVYYNYNYPSSGSFISSDNQDFFTVYDFLVKNNQLKIYQKFESIYASDDLITAKENQQSYEDQVVSDFTGSGSAAAKASDASSAKNISSAVSSGLNSGGSVNNSLSVFNPSGGFWGWFSQENSDLINTLSSQNRLRSSGSGSDWVSDDPYQRNAEELQSILGGNR